jgi:diguanylate cyclase (GGDEF)-like protein
MKILLVEDDPATRQLLALHLTAARYTVEQATDGQIALDLALDWNYDLIILDLNLPHLDGLSLCRQLRRRGSTTPILILTAQTGDEHIITGLDAGADDYVTKPFEVQSVMARVRALLRRGAVATEIPSLIWGRMQLDPGLAQVTYDGAVVPLTPKEYSLLELFLRHPHRVFSRSNILDHLWSIDDSPTEGAVTNLVKDLRNRLKRSGIAETVIQTVYGLGYRLGDSTEPTDADHPQGDRDLDQPSGNGAGLGPSPGYLSGDPQRNLAAQNDTQNDAQPSTDSPPSVATGIAIIAQRFQSSLSDRLDRLNQAIHTLQTTGLADPDRHAAIAEAHQLAGGLGTFGYGGTAPARRLEALLGQAVAPTADQVAQITQVFQQLQQEIARDKPPGPRDNLGLETSPSATIHGEASHRDPSHGSPSGLSLGCRVLVVNVGETMAQQLQACLPQMGYGVEIRASLPNLTTTPLSPQVGAVLLGLDSTTAAPAKLAPLQALRGHYPHLPVLVITSQESLEERVQVARLQGHRYLVAPVGVSQVVDALDQVLPYAQPPESRVLVVDDDPLTLSTIQDLLPPWGLQVFGLSDPRQFWDQLRRVQPDLLILALDTPTFSGFDLCQVVRQDPTYGNLPTLMLATCPDTVTVSQVFEAGGDDLIGKPIVGPELVTRVLSRVERSRLRQQLDQMQQQRALHWVQSGHHDPLTQLSNGAHLNVFLQQQWDRHRQDRAPLALIHCTLDDLNVYQQIYGQGASHGILRRVARTLYHTINPHIDLVARSGDTQFSLVLPNTNLDGALRVATQIQQTLDQLRIPHGASRHRPHLTLSLGISGTIPTDPLGPEQLMVAADQALREAQARGGNTLSLYPITR